MDASARAAQALPHDALWYKDAIIYQVHVKSFFDSNNDGIGDFPGLISKLDYIADRGPAPWDALFFSGRRRDELDLTKVRSTQANSAYTAPN